MCKMAHFRPKSCFKLISFNNKYVGFFVKIFQFLSLFFNFQLIFLKF